ncbi:hypothetical protein Poly21_10880 [Allorhodopirellula heiligendammensis]|uniref:Uncharacterized protein n=1 Tax=Allorhodopirellula heiligendammensis TaxID=2714739 RepID=A0A5C6C4J6_9BACT|nr:hypothetical protein Poly21_10880 [Allorhodopirellula heiligendammensis]
MMNVVVNNIIVVIDVFGTKSITHQQDSCLTQVSKFRIGDAITLGMQVQSYACAARIDEATGFHAAIFGTAETN